jgi:hypothetical protein
MMDINIRIIRLRCTKVNRRKRLGQGFSKVMNVVELNYCVCEWLHQVARKHKAHELEQWALDGKVLRGSHRYALMTQNGDEMLNLYAVASGTLEYCQRINRKGLEATPPRAFSNAADDAAASLSAIRSVASPVCRQNKPLPHSSWPGCRRTGALRTAATGTKLPL